jgi:hypothetical protein
MVQVKLWRAVWIVALMAAPVTVQAQASPYLPVDDVAYRYVDALMARGLMQSLSLLEVWSKAE